MNNFHKTHICAFLISLAVLTTGCSQTVSSSASTESSSVSVSSPASSMESSSVFSSSSSSSSDVSVSSESTAANISNQSSESITSSPSSTASISSESTVQQEEPQWWEELLDSSIGEEWGTSYKIYDNQRRISVGSNYFLFSKQENSGDLALLRDTAKPVTSEELGAPLPDISFFEILTGDDVKYTGKLYVGGIALSKAEPSEDAGEPVYLAIGEEDFQEMLSRFEESFDSEGTNYYPSWLTIMRLSKCETIIGECDDGQLTVLDSGSGERRNVFEILQTIPVQPDSVKSVKIDTELSNAKTVYVNFYNGIQYRLQVNSSSLLIASSDMSYALKYALANNPKHLLEDLDADNWDYENNPATAKPVIYLYPETPTDVTVEVDYQGAFTYTYPAYNDGWNVTAYPDGRIINHADASEHYYLFWEGNTDKTWKFEEGFCIPGEETERFLVAALSQLGLTPREYNDFIVYWLPEMQHNPYNLITFAAEEYEELAPMEITPAPDSILRVHMVYKALQEPIEIPAQTLPAFERNGFTVVEWGGSRA